MLQRVPVSPLLKCWLQYTHNVSGNTPIRLSERTVLGIAVRHMLYSMPPSAAQWEVDPVDLGADILVDVPEKWDVGFFTLSDAAYRRLSIFLYKALVYELRSNIDTLHRFGVLKHDMDYLTKFIERIGVDDHDDKIFYALQKAVLRLNNSQNRELRRGKGLLV